MVESSVERRIQQLTREKQLLIQQIQESAMECGQSLGYEWAARTDYLGFGPHHASRRPVLVSIKPRPSSDLVILRIQPIHDRGGERGFSMKLLDPATRLNLQSDDPLKSVDTVRIEPQMDIGGVKRMIQAAIRQSTYQPKKTHWHAEQPSLQ